MLISNYAREPVRETVLATFKSPSRGTDAQSVSEYEQAVVHKSINVFGSRKNRERSRMMIAFYGSTPNYAAVFDHHGYEGLTAELNAVQKRGDIGAMNALVKTMSER